MRLLLISNTHGELGIINERVEQLRADAVIHAGDFGFHDHGSIERASVREVAMHLLHSDMSREQIRAAEKMTPDAMRAFAAENLCLSELPEFIQGKQRFRVPVHAIWGNHEDVTVIDALRQGEIRAENLLLLDERAVHSIGPLRLFGLGGNVIPQGRSIHGTDSVKVSPEFGQRLLKEPGQLATLLGIFEDLEHRVEL